MARAIFPLLALLLMLLPGAVLPGQAGAPGEVTLELHAGRVGPADAVLFSGGTGEPGLPFVRVDVMEGSVRLARVVARADGAFSGSFPAPLAWGTHTVRAVVRPGLVLATPGDLASPPVSFVVAGPAPAPEALVATLPSGRLAVQLSWDLAPQDPLATTTAWRVQRAWPAGSFETVGQLPASARTFEDATAPVASAPRYRVTPIVRGQFGDPAMATPDGSLVDAIGLVAASNASHVALSWSTPLEADAPQAYVVHRRTLPAGAFTSLATLPGTATSFADALVRAGAYEYRVTAANVVRTSGGALVSITLDLPGAPTALAANVSSSPSVRLTWVPPADTDGLAVQKYNVYRAVGTGPFVLVAERTWESYLDVWVEREETYRYHVTAVTARGEGAPAETTVTVPLPTTEFRTNITAFHVCDGTQLVRCRTFGDSDSVQVSRGNASISLDIGGWRIEDGAFQPGAAVHVKVVGSCGDCGTPAVTHEWDTVTDATGRIATRSPTWSTTVGERDLEEWTFEVTATSGPRVARWFGLLDVWAA